MDAPENYILRQTFEPEIEQETQNQYSKTAYTQETQTEQPNTQSTSSKQTDDATTSGLTKTFFNASPGKQPLLDNDVFNHLITELDFEKLTLDGLIDTGALTSAISEADLNKMKLLSNEAIKDSGPAPNFQIMVAIGQIERPIGTVLLESEVADFQFQEIFIVMKILPNSLIGLSFLQRHKALFNIRQGIITIPYLSMQLRPEHTTNTRVATPCWPKLPTPSNLEKLLQSPAKCPIW